MPLIDDVIDIAKQAGQVVREGFGQNFRVEFKSSETNLVTEIDKKSEKLIIDFVKKQYPSHGVLAEESGGERQDSEYVWVIDPIDGTNNFAHGLPIFSVSIGVQKSGETICGIVYDVMRDVAYTTELGGGAYANGRKIGVSLNDNIKHSMLVTGFPYDVSDNPKNVYEIFGGFLKLARGIRRLGSAAIDFCYVAEGVFDGFWEVHLNPWDMCAGVLLVEEAGGKVTDFSGKRGGIFAPEVLATNGRVHETMLETIREFRSSEF